MIISILKGQSEILWLVWGGSNGIVTLLIWLYWFGSKAMMKKKNKKYRSTVARPGHVHCDRPIHAVFSGPEHSSLWRTEMYTIVHAQLIHAKIGSKWNYGNTALLYLWIMWNRERENYV